VLCATIFNSDLLIRNPMGNSCKQCGVIFNHSDEDLKFYDKVSPIFNGNKYQIPVPKLCPDCRQQRRLAFRNERSLYYRKCDLSGKQIVAMYPQETPFPVYHITEWQSDKWDAKDYGRNFDFNRPFFEQFQELCNEVPHLSLLIDPLMDDNAEFTNCSSEARNCYLISQAEKNENAYYSRGINNCRDCCDCLRVHSCELCYECINLNNCYNCKYCQDSDNCSDCYFSSDLRGCKFCFGCHGIAQKEYYIFNKKVSKEEWHKKVQELILTPSVIEHMKENSLKTRLKVPQRNLRNIQCLNSVGDNLQQCKEAENSFDSKDLENCKYCYEIMNGAKDSQDFSMWGLNCELLYDCVGCGYNVYNTLFSFHCWQNISNLIYCFECFPSVKDCFGCISIRKSKYCILNKQYTKEEYEELVPKIIEHMKKTGEWGEFFPITLSPFGYNETDAQEYFIMKKEEVLLQGWKWKDDEKGKDDYLGPKIEIPESIENSYIDICDKILQCESTGKLYKITPQEFSFYKKIGVPLPRKSPEQRHKERVALRNPRNLWTRNCDKCGIEMQTTYAPDRPEIVYCEECYLKEVY